MPFHKRRGTIPKSTIKCQVLLVWYGNGRWFTIRAPGARDPAPEGNQDGNGEAVSDEFERLALKVRQSARKDRRVGLSLAPKRFLGACGRRVAQGAWGSFGPAQEDRTEGEAD